MSRDERKTERGGDGPGAGGPRRVGLAGLSCECCTFSPAITGAADFDVKRGAELGEAYAFLPAAAGVELVPLARARAIPGGPIAREYYEELRRELLGALERGGPWDGLLLPMHGAAFVVGLEDAEADLLASIRGVVGPDCAIAASYDLHGNLSAAAMRNLDLVTAYRTAPHVDVEKTVARAWRLLVETLRGGRRPARAFVPVPLLLPGEKTSTEWEPGARLWGSIPELVERHELLDASILVGYAWADEPRAGASVVALARDGERAHRAAVELATALWDARSEFGFGVEAGPADECLQRALESPVRPVVVSDSGDNPTAGGAGDVPFVLERLLALGATDAIYASLVDPGAVARCREAGVGAELDVALGGRLDPANGTPFPVRGRVRAVVPPDESAAPSPGTVAVLEVEGVRVVVTERRAAFHRLADFERLGLDPRLARLVVVKIGYLEPELRRLGAASFLALGPGAVNQELEALPFRRLRRPIFPLDSGATWRPPERSTV